MWVGGARKGSDATVGPQAPAQQQQKQRPGGQSADQGAVGPALGGQQVCKDALPREPQSDTPECPQGLRGWQAATVSTPARLLRPLTQSHLPEGHQASASWHYAHLPGTNTDSFKLGLL